MELVYWELYSVVGNWPVELWRYVFRNIIVTEVLSFLLAQVEQVVFDYLQLPMQQEHCGFDTPTSEQLK